LRFFPVRPSRLKTSSWLRYWRAVTLNLNAVLDIKHCEVPRSAYFHFTSFMAETTSIAENSLISSGLKLSGI